MSRYDPASLSDDEDDDESVGSRSTWASSSDATILGFADGYVGKGAAELEDWHVNRLGGQPSFPVLRSKPPVDSNRCRVCSNAMPLIMQIYCPLESSPNERVMYTFACPRRPCQGKDGSVRVWRANIPFPPEDEEEATPVAEEPAKPVALGSLIFGGPAAASTGSNPFASTTGKSAEADEVAKRLQESMIEGDAPSYMWDEQPAFPPQYLTTAYEPPSPPTKKVPLAPSAAEELPEPKHREGKGAGGRDKKGQSATGDQWGKEGYEVQKVKGVDEVFLNFQERVSREGKQVVRYDFSSTPLPFSEHSDAFDKLFKRQTNDSVPQYDPSRLARCSCGTPRAFEFQIMPHAVTLLNKAGELPSSTAWPRSTSAQAAAKAKEKVLEQDGLDFATAMAFSCVGECTDKEGETWKEELVLIEMES